MTLPVVTTALVSVAAFLVAFVTVGIVRVARDAIETAGAAVNSMQDPSLDDLLREKAVQKASLQLFAALGKLIVKSGIAMLAGALPLILAESLGIVSSDEVMSFLLRWDVIIGLSMLMIVGWLLVLRIWPSK